MTRGVAKVYLKKGTPQAEQPPPPLARSHKCDLLLELRKVSAASFRPGPCQDHTLDAHHSAPHPGPVPSAVRAARRALWQGGARRAPSPPAVASPRSHRHQTGAPVRRCLEAVVVKKRARCSSDRLPPSAGCRRGGRSSRSPWASSRVARRARGRRTPDAGGLELLVVARPHWRRMVVGRAVADERLGPPRPVAAPWPRGGGRGAPGTDGIDDDDAGRGVGERVVGEVAREAEDGAEGEWGARAGRAPSGRRCCRPC